MIRKIAEHDNNPHAERLFLKNRGERAAEEKKMPKRKNFPKSSPSNDEKAFRSLELIS